MTTVNTYPFDPTGTAISNKIVKEEQILTAANSRDFHFIIPSYAPFFHQGLIVRHVQSNRILVEGVDFVLGYQFVKASRAVAKPIYGAIIFYDRSLVGVVQVTYQTIGGEWTLNPLKIAEILADRTINPRITTWEQVADQPDRFPPIDHEWDVDDLVGMTEVVTSLNSIANAIRQGADETALAHFTNYDNPHQTTKAQVGLGLVENLPRSDTQTAIAGTSNNAYMTPKTTASAIDSRAGALVTAHVQDHGNPHQVDKGQVGLGNVQNYGIANDNQAEAAAAADLYMTPRATRLAVQAIVGAQLTGHMSDYDNPHRTTKAQIGLSDVQNYAVATDQEATDGLAGNKYMTAYTTKIAIASQAITLVNTHASRTDNPHGTTKTQVGLGNVQNYGMASDQEAIDGVAGDKYMSPRLTKLTIQQLAGDNIGVHVSDYNNPHHVTAAQVGAYTTAQINTMLEQYLTLGGTAANASKLGGKTLAEVIALATGGNVDATTLSGKTLQEIYDAVAAMTVDNAVKLGGSTKAQLTSIIVQEVSASKVSYAVYPAPAAVAPYYTQVAIIPYYPNGSLVADTDKKLMISGVEQSSSKNGGLYFARLSMKKDSDIASIVDDEFLQVIESITPTVPDDCQFGYVLDPGDQRIELWVKSPTPRSNMTVVDLSPNIGSLTTAEAVQTVEPEGIVYVQKQRFITNLDLTAAFNEVFADMLDAMLLVANFAAAPQNLLSTKYTAASDIKTEYVILVDRGLFQDFSTSTYQYSSLFSDGIMGNYDAIQVGATDVGSVPQIEGTTLVNDGSKKLMWTAGGQAISGNWSAGTFSGVPYFDYSFTLDSSILGHPNYLSLPELVEIKFPHTTTLNGRYNVVGAETSEAFRIYSFFRPMADVAADYTFVDNLGFPGIFDFIGDVYSRTDDIKPPHVFTGIIKRTAIGKKAQELVDSDIILGVIANGATGKFIVNGNVVWTRSDLPVNSVTYQLRGTAEFSVYYNAVQYLGMDGLQSAITAGATLQQALSGMKVTISNVWVCGNAADAAAKDATFIKSGSPATTYPINLENGVFATMVDDPYVQDAAGTARGDTAYATVRVDGYSNFDREVMSGRFYQTP